jgi:hypothetical protein
MEFPVGLFCFAINTKTALFFIREAAKQMNNGGKVINTLLAASTGLYSVYAGGFGMSQALSPPRAQEVSVNSIPLGPLDTSCFYPVASLEAINYHKWQGTSDKPGNVKGIVPLLKFLATELWWDHRTENLYQGRPYKGLGHQHGHRRVC